VAFLTNGVDRVADIGKEFESGLLEHEPFGDAGDIDRNNADQQALDVDGVDEVGDVKEIEPDNSDEDKNIEFIDSSGMFFSTAEDENGGEFMSDVLEHVPTGHLDDIDQKLNPGFSKPMTLPDAVDEDNGPGNIEETSAESVDVGDEDIKSMGFSEVSFSSDGVVGKEDGEFKGKMSEYEPTDDEDASAHKDVVVQQQAQTIRDAESMHFELTSSSNDADGAVKSESIYGNKESNIQSMHSAKVTSLEAEIYGDEDGVVFESGLLEHTAISDGDNIDRDDIDIQHQTQTFDDYKVNGETESSRSQLTTPSVGNSFGQQHIDYGIRDIESILEARLKRSGESEVSQHNNSDDNDGAI